MTHSSFLKSHCQTAQSDSIQAGGSGAPVSCMTPAGADAESAHTKSAQTSSLFIDSPSSVEVVDVDGRAPAVTLQCTTGIDPDDVRFHALASARDFDSMQRLCLERLHNAPESTTRLRWKKDFSIVKSLMGCYGEAYDILSRAEALAVEVGGVPRAKYHAEFALVLLEFGRPLLSLDHFEVAHGLHLSAGNIAGAGVVDNNKALALDSMGETREAERAARSAVQIATTCNPAMLRESYATWERIEAKLRGNVR